MENKFYAIASSSGKMVLFVDSKRSSSLQDKVMLNVAPSSATFFNYLHEAMLTMLVCAKLHPSEEFKILTFDY